MWRDRRGNVAMITALMMVVIMGLIGGAVDFARYSTLRMEMDSAVEAAVLAAASLTQERDPESVVSEFLDSQVSLERYSSDISFDVTSHDSGTGSKTITVSANGTINTFFLSLLGVDELEVVSEATASQSTNDLEIALVLDVSGSMGGSKISNLRDAAVDFIEEIYDNSEPDSVSMSIIPFAASVNISPIFNDYAYEWTSANVDPDASEYNIGYNVPYGTFRFSGSHASHCIELHDDDFGTFEQLPYRGRAQIRYSDTYSDSTFCPGDDRAVMFNSKSESDLKAKIMTLYANGNTAINEGALWGAYALSPHWRGDLGGDDLDRPHDFVGATAKVLVIMTDGEMVQGNRVRIGEGERCVSSFFGWCLRWENNPDSTQRVRDNGRWYDDVDDDTASAQLKRVCDVAKENNILVYTIGFDINSGGDSDHLLEYCATASSYYFFVEGLDINSAFEDIAASLNALRIIG